MLGHSVGIDLGTSTITFFVEGKGIVISEPCVVALETETGKLLAAGEKAVHMIGRTPSNITVIRPVKNGVISDYVVTEKMLRYFLRKITGNSVFKPKIMVSIPSIITGVEEKTIKDVLVNAGARKSCIIQKSLACALGAGVDTSSPHGTFVVDFGGGTVDIAVITLADIAVTNTLNFGGQSLDMAIAKYIRKKYNILIGALTAEKIKKKIGCAMLREIEIAITARGRNYLTGMPDSFEVTSTDVYWATKDMIDSIIVGIIGVLENTPPELIGDVYTDGIILAGGSSQIYGFDKLLTQITGIKCLMAPNPADCVALGIGKAIGDMDTLITGEHIVLQQKNTDK